MENQNNTPTRSTPSCSGEQVGADTNKLKDYRVTLFWTATSRVDLLVKAESQEDAEDKADNIESADLFDDMMDPVAGEITLDEVELATDGESQRLPRITRDLTVEE